MKTDVKTDDIADALEEIGKAIRDLGFGNGLNDTGAFEGHSMIVRDAFENLTSEIRSASRRQAFAIFALARAVAKEDVDWDLFLTEIKD